MKRNSINVTIKELVDLAYELMEDVNNEKLVGVDIKTVFSIPIIAPNNDVIGDRWRFKRKPYPPSNKEKIE